MRVDTYAEEGLDIPPFYDSLLAKLVAHAADRPAAIARAHRALNELEIEGVTTTISVVRGILESAEFQSGDYSTSFIGEMAVRQPALISG